MLLLQAMEDGFIGHLGLAVSPRMCHSSKASLAAQVAKVVRELAGVKLPIVVKNYGTRDVKVGDDVPPNELSQLCGGYGCYSRSLEPLGDVIHRHEEVRVLSRSLGKGMRMSIPHVAKGRGLTISIMMVEGTHWMGTNFTHLSQVRTSVIACSHKLGQ